jgi:Chemotaxis protein
MKEADVIAPQAIIDQTMNDLMSFLHEYAKTTTIDSSTQEELLAFIQTTLGTSLDKALHENIPYRQINTEMCQGLQDPNETVTTVADSEEEKNAPEITGYLFNEVEEHLNEVMAITLEAAEDIMAEVEHLLDRLQEMSGYLETMKESAESESISSLVDTVATFESSLTQIMVSLSFQDLSGQRLKKVETILGEIQGSIFGMYISNGLRLKADEYMPERNMEEIARESKLRMDAIKNAKGPKLRGPTRGSNQADVDRLLDDLDQFR